MYKVTVKPDYRWNDAQVAGRIFSKRAVIEIGEAAMNDEIRNSPLLDVVEVKDAKEKVKAVTETKEDVGPAEANKEVSPVLKARGR